MSDSNWIVVIGEEAKDLAFLCAERKQTRVSSKEYSEDDIKYIAKLSFLPSLTGGEISDERLRQLKRLSECWDVELRLGEITSHRRFIGPIIVGVKKLLFPMLKSMLSETMKQQRRFNAEVISVLTDLSKPSSKKDLDPDLN